MENLDIQNVENNDNSNSNTPEVHSGVIFFAEDDVTMSNNVTSKFYSTLTAAVINNLLLEEKQSTQCLQLKNNEIASTVSDQNFKSLAKRYFTKDSQNTTSNGNNSDGSATLGMKSFEYHAHTQVSMKED